MFDLSGRTALVTGAGQGVGRGIALALATQGAAVHVNDLVAERAAEAVAEIESTGGRAAVAAFDVTELDAVSGGVDAIGPVDILVNNAGNGGAEGMVPTQFRDMDPSAWEGPIAVNLYGVLHCCHAVLPGMVDSGFGRIVTISSGAGTTGLRLGVSPYAAGKGGAISFMRHLAVENARSGITANSVALGLMDSQGGPSEATEHLARSIPAGRLGTPDDAAAICVYLASDEASWITGQTIGLNGGSTTS